MEEIWLPIPEWPNYEASNLGQIRSVDRVATNKLGHDRMLKGMIRRPYITKGYFRVILCDVTNGRKPCFLVHRLVASAFVANPDKKSQVNHIDGNKLNNQASNLEWNTPLENTLHSIRMGLSNKSDGNNSAAKLTNEQVLTCISRFSRGARTWTLAAEYGVTVRTMRRIVLGKSYKKLYASRNEKRVV